MHIFRIPPIIPVMIVAAATVQAAEPRPSVTLKAAPLIRFPGAKVAGLGMMHADSNSPAHWDVDTLYVFNSWEHPWRSSGASLEELGQSAPVKIDADISGGRWLQATWQSPDGKLYGWYHNEPDGWTKPGKLLKRYPTAPRVGAMVSADNGKTWHDFGLVITAATDTENRRSKNAYFIGGIGDFCACADANDKYIYFFLTSYHADIRRQGLITARLALADRDAQVGKVRIWDGKGWEQPGKDGQPHPFLPVSRDWHGERPDGFWGPSIHWNTAMKMYVMFLNRVKDPRWGVEGIYVSLNRDLANPEGWSAPSKILDAKEPGVNWYVTVIGTGHGETDKLVGPLGRLFVHGVSRWEVHFHPAGQKR